MAGSSIGPSERLVGRNFLLLGSGEALSRLISFAVTVYLARTLGVSGYGVIGFATAVMLYLSRVAEGGLELVGVHQIAEDPSRISDLAPSILTLRLLIAVGLACALALLALLFLPQPESTILALYSLTLLPTALNTRWVHMGLERGRLVALARTCGEAAAALVIVSVVRSVHQLPTVPLAQLIGDGIAALILIVWLGRRGFTFAFRLNFSVLRPIVRRSWPLVATALLGLLIYNCDLIMLRVLRDRQTVGYYAAAYMLIGFMITLGMTYRLSLLPTLARLRATSADPSELYHRAMIQLFAAALPVSVGGILLAPRVISTVFGAAYAPAALPLQLLLLSLPFSLLRDLPVAGLVIAGREQLIFRLTLAAAVLNLMLNLLLIPPLGMTGAALSTLVTEIARLSIIAWYAHGHGFGLSAVPRFWRPLVAALGMAALLIAFGPQALWIAVPMGATGYIALLVFLGGIRLRRGQMPALEL